MRLYLLLSLSIILFSNCKKETKEEVPGPVHEITHLKIDPTIYPFLFDSGSFWVYKDTFNGNIDSTLLTKVTQSFYLMAPSHPGQGSPGDVEYFDMKYFSNYTSSIYVEQLFAYVISRNLFYGGFVFISTKQIGDTETNAEITDVIDSMNIENNTYRNVTKMKVTADNFITGNHNFYYADSIGLIRKETVVNDTIVETWNLLRYSVRFFNYH